jgi:hypothetical protein
VVLLRWLLERDSALRALLNKECEQYFSRLSVGRLKKGWVLNLVLWQREKLVQRLAETSVVHRGLSLERLQEA